jgi:beta-fructofuranosidase
MIIGSGVKGEGGMALMYRSPDLRKWEYLHPLAKGPVQKPAKPGGIELSEMWECPDFFPLGPKHVLVVSTGGKAPYFTGAYDGRHFEPLSLGQTDFGCAYAPKTMPDAKGRRIYWAWIRERRTKEAHTAAGWAGVMSLPRVMTLGTGPALGMEPAPELRSLRTKNVRIGPSAIPPGEQQLLKGVHGDCLEIVAELDPGDARRCGIRVRCSPNGEEQVRIYYQRPQELLAVDTTRSSLGKEVSTGVEQGSFHLAAGEKLRLQVFLDGSVIEVFANGRFCLTERSYPTRLDSLGIGLFAEGGKAKLVSMDVWQMRPISPNRLTS